MMLRPLLLILLLLLLSASAVVVPSQTVWQFDPLSYGYVYNAQERPGLNVPADVDAADLLGSDVCAVAGGFTNLSCTPAPERVRVEILLNSIDSIDSVAGVMQLNFVINSYWRDWRLAYAESGLGCWAGVTPLPVTALSLPALLQNLTTSLRLGWGCTAAGDCTASLSLAGLGLLPAVTVVPDGPLQGQLSVFPAPQDLQPSCAAAVISVSGNAAPPFCSSAAAAFISPLLASGTWLPHPVPCQGVGARRQSPSVKLDVGQGGRPSAGGGPWAVDANAIWDPQLDDSFNQDGGDNLIDEQLTLWQNGTVKHHRVFQNTYLISGKDMWFFPYDRPIYVATRRSYGLYADDLQLVLGAYGENIPQAMDGFFVDEVGATIYTVHDSGMSDPSDCGQPGAAPCSQMVVLWLQLRRNPLGWTQNMIAPLTLVVMLIASAFYTDLADYDVRSLVLGTSTIALMALLPYLAAALPGTVQTTFIHTALFTTYALLGISFAVVIAVSFFLSSDIVAASGGIEPAPTDDQFGGTAGSPGNRILPSAFSSHLPLLRRKARNMSSLFKSDGMIHCKPWLMRLYYRECFVMQRLLSGRASVDDCAEPLVYFGQNACVQLQHALRLELVRAAAGSRMPDGEPHTGEEGLHAAADVALPDSAMAALVAEARPERLPKQLSLRLFLIELDLAMRYLVIGTYFLVLCIAWQRRTVYAKTAEFSCGSLVSYFSDGAHG